MENFMFKKNRNLKMSRKCMSNNLKCLKMEKIKTVLMSALMLAMSSSAWAQITWNAGTTYTFCKRGNYFPKHYPYRNRNSMAYCPIRWNCNYYRKN